MNKRKLCIAIPASVASDTPHLREKTSKIGLIGRAAAIFRVDEIIIYPDTPYANQKADMDLIAGLLSYMETPQYLRKILFKLKPELQYAGILPPLRTPHHPLNRRTKGLKVGEYREGAILSKAKEGVLIDIGVEKPALAKDTQRGRDRRVTVKITKTNKRIEVELVDPKEIPVYWGYKVTVEERPFGKFLKRRDFDLVIATSRYGAPFVDVDEEIVEKWKGSNTVLVAFGAPAQGMREITKHEGLRLDEIVDFVVNTIPMQGTETVRTEEALFASLAVLNIALSIKGLSLR